MQRPAGVGQFIGKVISFTADGFNRHIVADAFRVQRIVKTERGRRLFDFNVTGIFIKFVR